MLWNSNGCCPYKESYLKTKTKDELINIIKCLNNNNYNNYKRVEFYDKSIHLCFRSLELYASSDNYLFDGNNLQLVSDTLIKSMEIVLKQQNSD